MRLRPRLARTHLVLAVLAFPLSGIAQAPPAKAEGAAPAQVSKAAPAPARKPAAKKAPPGPTIEELERLLAEQRAQVEAQAKLTAELQAQLAEGAKATQAQVEAAAAQEKRQAELQEQLLALLRRLDELQQELPSSQDRQALAERLRRVEEAAQKEPELPPSVVSAGDFPGSIRIPGTDAAIKLGGRIRTAAVLTLDPLGSSDRFVTNTIPVEDDDAAAGTGRRTTFSANTSRFNFDMRTPSGVGQVRAFLEGDFFGTNAADSRTNFRLRHAYAQFSGFIVGQTWSTFSDPSTSVEDLDFEGINGENVIRQPQLRWIWKPEEPLSAAVAAETPEVSLTGGKGENMVPDLVGRLIWRFGDDGVGHLQTAVVLRQIRGTSEVEPTRTRVTAAWGASLSGLLPVRVWGQDDRVLFQLNVGRGNARYINDLNSLGGQDAAFDPVTGDLEAIQARGWYLVYEHQWKAWETTRTMRLRSSFIWSRVIVDNLGFQPDDAYHRTDRWAVNLVFSPTKRIDVGLEGVYGERENKGGGTGSARQLQAVAILRF